jgi:hypothetical protein
MEVIGAERDGTEAPAPMRLSTYDVPQARVRAFMTLHGVGRIELQFPVTSAQNPAGRPDPGVVVESLVGITGDKPVQVDIATEQSRDEVAFQVQFSIVAFYQSGRQKTADPIE